MANSQNKINGFGLLEAIVALGVFAVISSLGVIGFIPALQLGRTSREQTQASTFASEGLEAVRSIRDRNFGALSLGNFGIGISNSLWTFSGSSDVNDKYLRQIKITQANRDTGGSLVSFGGTTDPNTFIISSSVYWNYSIGDSRSISTDAVFTNWRKNIASALNYDGLVVYSSGNTVTPFWRTYTSNSNTFGTQSTLPSVTGSPRNFVVRTSPTKNEAIAGILSTDGKLYVYCFDGTLWSQEWSATIGVGTTRTLPFDIAFENTSGKSMIVYSTNAPTTNEINFRTKSGSLGCGAANWSSSTAFDPIRTSAQVSWIKLTSNPISGSNLVAALWVDWNKDLSSAVWNGTNFANEMTTVGDTSVESINTGTSYPDVQSFDLAYESVTGDLMTIWGNSSGANGTNGVRYRLCTGNTSTCTWGAVTTPPTFSDDATSLDLSSNPNSDEMIFASIGNAGSDLQIGYWSGIGWTNTANVDTTAQTPFIISKIVAAGWLNSGATSRSIVTYNDAGGTNIGWYACNRGVCTVQTDFTVSPIFGVPQNWYEIAINPKSKDQLMFTISDTNLDLFAKRLVMTSAPLFTWTNADSSAALQSNLGQSTVKPFGFTYWQK